MAGEDEETNGAMIASNRELICSLFFSENSPHHELSPTGIGPHLVNGTLIDDRSIFLIVANEITTQRYSTLSTTPTRSDICPSQPPKSTIDW